PLAFLCLPPLVYAAFRFGQREAATCVALLAGLAIVGTLAGHGPVARDSQNESLLLLQAFMMTLTIVTLPLAAIVREHGRSEAALAQSAAIVAFSDDAIIGKRLDGVITTWNEGAQRLYGYTSAEAVGRPISLIIPPELADELPTILERLGRGVRIDHFETTRVAKDGRRIDVSVTVSPVRDPWGRIIGASSIARDITHRRQIEGTRRERDTLRSVASLAAGAAHEINNPLAVVMGQAQLLSDEIAGPGRQRVGEILQAIDRIRAIVARMRHVTRVELMDSTPGLPPMLDINRSSEPEVSEGPAAGSCLVIVAREERARRESLRRMFAGDGARGPDLVSPRGFPVETLASSMLPEPAGGHMIPEPFSSARILIVDDEPAMVRLLEQLLSHAGYTNLLGVTDSRTVVQCCDDFLPDLIVLDLRMPLLDGVEVLKRLKQRRAELYLPVLVLTADVSRESKRAALEAGASDFVTKPFEQTELLLRVRNLIEIRFLHRDLRRQNQTLAGQVQERSHQLLEAEKLATMGNLLAGVAHELNSPLSVILGQVGLFATTGGDAVARSRIKDIGEAAERCVRIVRSFLTMARRHPPERGP